MLGRRDGTGPIIPDIAKILAALRNFDHVEIGSLNVAV